MFKFSHHLKIISSATMIVGTSSSILAGAVNFESEPIETQDSFENKKLTEEAKTCTKRKLKDY